MTALKNGILVASDVNAEWLIPWWWMNYTMHNMYPVTFINFGNLSPWMVAWCQERGQVEDFSPPAGFNVAGPEERQTIWFKKPFAMLQSPYDRTIWFDLDCWIKSPIGDLFSACENSAGLGVVKEPEKYQAINRQKGLIKEDEVMFNAGVIVYKKNSPIMKLWTDELLLQHHLYYADQDALSHLLATANLPFTNIDSTYNWFPDGLNFDAKVVHMVGTGFKVFIKMQISYLKNDMRFKFP